MFFVIRGKTCGLCGNFNGNPNDEFHTPSGMTVNTPQAFGASWKVTSNYTCTDGCGSSCPRCANERPARSQCELIRAADGPLSFCHEQVDPVPYFNDCVFDVCISGNRGRELLCRAVETYVSACQSANVRIYSWRDNTTCSKSKFKLFIFDPSSLIKQSKKCLPRKSILIYCIYTKADNHHFIFSRTKDSTVPPTPIMSCVVPTVATPVPATLMPPVSRFAPRAVSVMKVLSGVGQDAYLWKDVAVNTMASTTM